MFRTKQDQFNPIKVRCEFKKEKRKKGKYISFRNFHSQFKSQNRSFSCLWSEKRTFKADVLSK